MQIEAIYKKGRLEFTQPVRFLRDQVKVTLEVADDEIIIENDTQSIQSSLDYLLGKHPDNSWLRRMKDIEKRVLSLSEDELPELTPKQLRNIQAFSLREDR